MRVSRLSVIGVTALAVSVLSPIAPSLADPPAPPYAAITSPTEGAEVHGVITVAGEGHLDPNGGATAVSLTLDVDGAPVGTPVDCTPGSYDCNGSFSYDTSALPSGTHALAVDLATSTPGDVLSGPVHITVVTLPTTSITTVTSPVTGAVDIGVTSSTDAASADTPASVDLNWGGTQIGSATCTPPGAHSCSVSVPWDTTLLPDATHDLVATMTTANNAHATGTQPSLAIHNPPPTVMITSPGNNSSGRGVITVHATGTIPAGERDHPQGMQLYLGDTSHPVAGQTVDCGGTGSTCDGTFTWDATGQSGGFNLIVGFLTTRGRTDTDSVHVTVSDPAPTVSIASPSEGATVSGASVAVDATGTVDPSQNDVGTKMQLFVGTRLVDSQNCPAASTCHQVLHWDASGVNGTQALKVVFTAARSGSGSRTVNVRVTTTPPTAGITSPVNGATVSGVVYVVANGVINPAQNDTPATMQLLIDGTAVSAPQPCLGTAAAPKSCSFPYGWDTTAMSGQHTLQAKFATAKGFTALGAVSTVTVVSPVPAASIVAPALNGTVHRTATITVTGAVDPSQTDAPSSMQLTLDGAALGAALPCTPATPGARTCSASYTWNTLGLIGRHTLVATLTTVRGQVGASSVYPVYVYAGTKTAFSAVKTQHYGKTTTVTGRVSALINKAGLGGLKVKIVVIPVTGHAKTSYVRTDAKGFFTASFKAALNTTVTATVVPPSYYGTSHTFTKVKVAPRAVCSVGRTVRSNRLDTGTCTIPNMLKGTRLTLEYSLKGHWYVISSGLSHGTTVPFSFRLAVRGNYLIRVVLGASKAFVASATPSLKVTVT